MIDSLIKQQTAWSQSSSKYQKQKKYTRSEISIGIMLIIRIYKCIFLMTNFKIVAIFLSFYLNLKNNCFFLVLYTHRRPTLLCISYHSVMKLPGSEPDFFLSKITRPRWLELPIARTDFDSPWIGKVSTRFYKFSFLMLISWGHYEWKKDSYKMSLSKIADDHI
jgi:hypothetical protein